MRKTVWVGSSAGLLLKKGLGLSTRDDTHNQKSQQLAYNTVSYGLHHLLGSRELLLRPVGGRIRVYWKLRGSLVSLVVGLNPQCGYRPTNLVHLFWSPASRIEE